MPRQAKKFVLELTDEQSAEIQDPPVTSTGGRQQLERGLFKQLQNTPNKILLNDKEIGTIIRYMTQYDKDKPPAHGGGLQGRLYRALGPAIKKITGL